ncbi:MAG: DUF1616 domain-containing protein [Candidatus Bathyarchaeia archaeon]
MSVKPRKKELALLVTRVIEEDKPQTVKQLVSLVKERFQVSEQEALECILKLQSEGKISFAKKPSPLPPGLVGYLKTGQALWYWITIAVSAATVVAVFTIQEGFYPWVYIRHVLGAIFVLWLPGYSFIKALFPKQMPIKLSTENLDKVERVALSLGMSLVLVPIVGLFLNYTPWGIRLTPIVLSLLALTLVFATVAVIREHQAGKE